MSNQKSGGVWVDIADMKTESQLDSEIQTIVIFVEEKNHSLHQEHGARSAIVPVILSLFLENQK